MSDLRVGLFYGFQLWDDVGEKGQSPDWFREYSGERGKTNKAFEKAVKEAGLQIEEYRCDGATYSDSVYFLAVKVSVVGGENGIHPLGQELARRSSDWQQLLEEFCQKHGKEFSVSFGKPEFILCGYSAD